MKVKQDSIYKKMLDKGFSMKDVEKAGFFIDNHTDETYVDVSKTLNIKCTPYLFLDSTVKPVVLVTTGSFNPIHNGHIEMMELAKKRLEKEGMNVVGGYFAPDHDEYISSKLGKHAIPFHYRMKIILDKLKELDNQWLTVDPWAGIFEPVAINFTRIICRLKAYLNLYYNKDVEIIYVCGSDHTSFSGIIHGGFRCVVINRGIEIKKEDKIEGNFYIDNGMKLSSTEIRKRYQYEKLTNEILLRVYDDERDERTIPLIYLFNKHFKKVNYNFFSDQYIEIKEIVNVNHLSNNIISLDSDIQFKNNLSVCRNFDYFGIKQLGYTNRPGTNDLHLQLRKLKIRKNYHLYDDDSSTGGTLNFVRSELKKIGIIIESENIIIANKNKTGDIADIKDFFFDRGNNNAWSRGLVINNERYPYVYPYVCPFIRSSIEDPLSFSIDVWKINMDFFQERNDIKSYTKCLEQYNSLLKIKKNV